MAEPRSQEVKNLLMVVKAIEYELKMRKIPEEQARIVGWKKASTLVKNFIIDSTGNVDWRWCEIREKLEKEVSREEEEERREMERIKEELRNELAGAHEERQEQRRLVRARRNEIVCDRCGEVGHIARICTLENIKVVRKYLVSNKNFREESGKEVEIRTTVKPSNKSKGLWKRSWIVIKKKKS
ncbi:hypothetical protein GINT2_001208 [Glugoides intestinalis]